MPETDKDVIQPTAPSESAPAAVETAAPAAASEATAVVDEVTSHDAEESRKAEQTRKDDDADIAFIQKKLGLKSDEPDSENTELAGEEESEETETAAVFAKEVADVIRRAGLDPDSKVFAGMEPAERAKFVQQQQTRVKYIDRLNGEIGQLRQQLAQANPNQATPPATLPQAVPNATNPNPPAAPDQAWTQLEGYFGKDEISGLKQAVESIVQQRLGSQPQEQPQQPQFSTAFLDRLQNDDIEAAYNSLELPEGIDKNDPVVREQIINEASRDLQGRVDLVKNNFRHAIPRVAAQLFAKQHATADKQRVVAQRSRALRGSPERGGRAPTTRPVLSDDERDDAIIKGRMAGKSLAAIERELNAG